MDCVNQLIDRGAKVQETDNTGFTPLHAAAFAGHAAVCKVLVSLGADPLALCGVNSGSGSGARTSVDLAAEASHTDVVKLLKLHSICE